MAWTAPHPSRVRSSRGALAEALGNHPMYLVLLNAGPKGFLSFKSAAGFSFADTPNTDDSVSVTRDRPGGAGDAPA